jgi:TolB-like protein/DNA-binding winged helix-turn-helix (wHTH) protein
VVTPAQQRIIARFEGFALLGEPLELLRDGERLRLQDMPLRILQLLVSRPGQLVSREELIARLWPKGVVEFDTGLNTAMRKLRAALGDDADAPRLIETVPRQGYRFIGPLHTEPAAQMAASPGTAAAAHTEPTDRGQPRAAPGALLRRSRVAALTAVALVLAIVFSGWVRPLFFAADPSSLSSRYRLAVLPFANLSPDSANAFFADAMHEEVLSALTSRAPTIDVISRATMTLYRDLEKPIDETARELGVTHLLEGTVRRDGERVRITVTLIDGASDRRMWSRTFDRELKDAMTLQAAVAAEVAQQLAGELSSDPMRLPPSRNLAAYDLWLKGVLAWQQVGGVAPSADIDRVESMFTRAIELDGGYAAAYADRARVRIAEFYGGKDDTEANAAAARADIATARKLAGDVPYVQIRAAQLAMLVDGDVDEALDLIAKAEAAGPLSGDFLMTKANFLRTAGHLDEALATHALAASLDPGNPMVVRFWMSTLVSTGRVAEALHVASAFEAKSPARISRGEAVFAYTGTTSRWRDELDLTPVADDPFDRLSAEAELLRFEGRLAELAALLTSAGNATFWPHSRFDQVPGVTELPVAELRGWERLLAGDRAAATRESGAVAEFLARRPRTERNAWWLDLVEAERALFAGDAQLAAELARRGLERARASPAVLVAIQAKARAARILAWAGAADEAAALLEDLSGGDYRLGPASVTRDPLYAIPLRSNERYRTLQARLEAAIATSLSLP